MSKLIIIALGNPEDKYLQTRHNAGWLALDTILETWQDPSIPISWKYEKKLQANVAKTNHLGSEIFALKPTTFMNKSGDCARAALQWYLDLEFENNPPSEVCNLLVLHDDLDLELGQYKLKFATGPQTHNGINNIRQQIKTDNFWYGRLGVDTRQGNRQIPPEAYVLQKLNAPEQAALKQVAQNLATEIEYVLL